MGVIPRNENVMGEIIQILEELQSSYVPTSADRKNLSTVRYASFINPWTL